MNFPFNAYLSAFAGACLVSWLGLPWWRRLCLRTGLVDDPGHRKIHATPTPLAGGFTVLAGILIPLLIGAAIVFLKLPHLKIGSAWFQHGFHRRGVELGAIILGALVAALTGCLDDKFELRPAPKFLGQLLAAFLVAFSGARITLFVPSAIFSYAVTILWVLSVMNAFNFMDNMNGLCAGLGAISAWIFSMVSMLDGQYLNASLSLAVCGALLGFLPHNFPKATAFLGDTGSHLTGYLIAVMAILPHFYTLQHPRAWTVFLPLLILAVPLGDLAWVVLLRWRRGQPFYVGDNSHLSHRLVQRGLSRETATVIIWFLSALAGALALLLLIYG